MLLSLNAWSTLWKQSHTEDQTLNVQTTQPGQHSH